MKKAESPSVDVMAKIWKIIRIQPEFNFNELAVLTECSYLSVRNYLMALYRAGYIKQGGVRKSITGRKRQVWRLIKNTGPCVPFPCRGVWDPNKKLFTELKELGHDR